MPEPQEIQPDLEKEVLPTDNIPVVKDDKHLDALVSEMPQVVPDAIAAADSKEKAAEQSQQNVFDHKGRAFDPNIHLADSLGIPIKTPTGRFRLKLRLPGGDKPSRLVMPVEETAAPADLKMKMAAAKLADVFIISGISFFGDEWKPEKTKDFDERAMLIDANTRWMIEHGYYEPPAWIDLALAYGLYTGKRVVQRKPEGRIQKIMEWGRMKATNVWLWATGQKIKVVPTEEHK